MIYTVVLSGFVLGAFAPSITRRVGERTNWLLALLPAAIFVYLATLVPTVADGDAIRTSLAWVPGLGVDLSFYVDGLSLLFALLISGIGTLVVIYTGGYLHGDSQLGRFYLYLLSFMAAMLGLVLADNVITLFVFWELTSITSFLLIGYNHDAARSRRAAMQALVVTGAGGLALLAGLLIMSAVGGSMELSVLNATAGDVLREHPAYTAMVVLVLLGAFSKSAQFPLHFWLPNAMEAPTPVSAYLHSSTMVKAGVYLVARLSPALGGTDLWLYALVIFGTATMLTGGILALRQTDLKLVLAYTTVAGLGTLVMLIGLGEPLAFKAAATFLITHALYKGALFMSAGAIDHEAGTRNPLELGGLARAMPISFAAAALAGLSMAGIIPFVGFIAKEVMYEATLHFGPTGGAILSACTILGNAFNVTAAGIVVVRPFLGPRKDLPKHPHEAPLSLYLGPCVLAGLSLAAGVLHPVTSGLFVGPMMTSLAGAPSGSTAADLYLWHGFKTPLFLSLATLAIGVLGYVAWHTIRHGIADALHWLGWGPDRGYDQFVAGMERVAFTQVRYQQTGYMRHYLIASFLALVGLVVLTLALFGGWPAGFAIPVVRLSEAVALVLLLGGAIVATLVFSRIAAVAAVGTVGYAVALIFVMFSAPDLAFTQFMVETLTVVILVMVLMRVPLEVRSMRTRFCRRRDAAIAIAVGASVSLLLMSTVQGDLDLRLTEFFVNASVPQAHGHNVVNVILVDFRALDTLGEIFVVTMAGLSTLGLVRLARSRNRRQGERETS
jgi:multicomponent Na+:H+ antiporter subunit A